MNSHNAFTIVAVIVLLIAAIAASLWGRSRGAALLDGWASSNGLRIVSREERWLFKGPFFWTSSKGQKVYRVTVRDGKGLTRSGYVRCGGYWLGLMADDVEVRWDD